MMMFALVLKMVRVKQQQQQQSGRRQKYHTKSTSRNQQQTLHAGQCGFFVTFASIKESFVRNELYNVLNRFADQLFGAEFPEEKQDSGNISQSDDLDAALANETAALNAVKDGSRPRRFQILKSGANHSLFVSTTLPHSSINRLAELIFDTVQRSGQAHSRYIERFLPIIFICKAYEDDLQRLISQENFVNHIYSLVDESDTSNKTIWFDVQARKSNNTTLKSNVLEEMIINELIAKTPQSTTERILRRDYKQPRIHILLHVIKNLILISIVRNYDAFKKYNLASVNLTVAVSTTTTTTTASQQQNKIVFEDNDGEEEEDEQG